MDTKDDRLKKLEEEMIRLEDEIDVAKIGTMISFTEQDKHAFLRQAEDLTRKREAVKEERRKLKNELKGN